MASLVVCSVLEDRSSNNSKKTKLFFASNRLDSKCPCKSTFCIKKKIVLIASQTKYSIYFLLGFEFFLNSGKNFQLFEDLHIFSDWINKNKKRNGNCPTRQKVIKRVRENIYFLIVNKAASNIYLKCHAKTHTHWSFDFEYHHLRFLFRQEVNWL